MSPSYQINIVFHMQRLLLFLYLILYVEGMRGSQCTRLLFEKNRRLPILWTKLWGKSFKSSELFLLVAPLQPGSYVETKDSKLHISKQEQKIRREMFIYSVPFLPVYSTRCLVWMHRTKSQMWLSLQITCCGALVTHCKCYSCSPCTEAIHIFPSTGLMYQYRCIIKKKETYLFQS